MATAISLYYAYLIEKDGTDNQNWTTDPDTIDLDNFTLGTDYCYLEHVTSVQKILIPDLQIRQMANAQAYMSKKGKRHYRLRVTGEAKSKANADHIDTFIMRKRHWKKADWKAYYFVLKHATDTFEKFMDNADVHQEYMTCGIAPNCTITRDLSDSQKADCWDVVWNLASDW